MCKVLTSSCCVLSIAAFSSLARWRISWVLTLILFPACTALSLPCTREGGNYENSLRISSEPDAKTTSEPSEGHAQVLQKVLISAPDPHPDDSPEMHEIQMQVARCSQENNNVTYNDFPWALPPRLLSRSPALQASKICPSTEREQDVVYRMTMENMERLEYAIQQEQEVM